MGYYEYYPNFISADYFDKLLPHFLTTCKSSQITFYGKTYPSRRISCAYFFSKLDNTEGIIYSGTPMLMSDQAPKELIEIKDLIEQKFNQKVDYILVHIYRDHTDYIGVHNDGEALDSEIFSVSLGATRKFQIYPIYDKIHPIDHYYVNNGDMVHMFGPREGQISCQRKYKHGVPKMKLTELTDFLTSKGLKLPTGRKTFQKCEALMKETNTYPVRINLTFRQFKNDV